MATLKTKITEVVTALGAAAPDAELPDAMAGDAAAAIEGLDSVDWEQIRRAYDAGDYALEFAAAFANGKHFVRVELEGRKPRSVEWRGGRKTLYHHDLPVDVRVDRVYLISCKYNSKVLLNPSPHALFAEALSSGGRGPDWYEETAPAEYAEFYRACVRRAGLSGFPQRPGELTRGQRDALRKAFPRRLPADLAAPYRRFAGAVAQASAERWLEAAAGRERDLLLKMLRISSVDYFFLGVQRGRAQRLKLLNSADWHRRFRVVRFDAWPARDALQPQVQWAATVEPRAPEEAPRRVEGHVEVRWSHGKFCGNPEAKVYLDTPIERAPGYEPF